MAFVYWQITGNPKFIYEDVCIYNISGGKSHREKESHSQNIYLMKNIIGTKNKWFIFDCGCICERGPVVLNVMATVEP